MPCFPTLIECRLRDKHIEASSSDIKAVIRSPSCTSESGAEYRIGEIVALLGGDASDECDDIGPTMMACSLSWSNPTWPSRVAVGEVAFPPRTDALARIVTALEPRPGELVVNKTTFGTFASTGLDHALRSLGITSLVVGGVVTNVCVETTAREATDRGYEVVLVDDGCAAFSPEIHEATLLSFQGHFGRVGGAAKC
jgi:hypothetical protein